MKNLLKRISLLLIVLVVLVSAFACEKNPEQSSTSGNNSTGGGQQQLVDYVSQLKLDMQSSTAKQEVTVKLYIDGDTTHFNVPTSLMENGILKARYLAINTPESTGKIEPYGKTASAFTREKLEKAVSIIIESDGATWEPDSTGSRYLSWIWYKTSEDGEYRNLNLEILQNGLALASNTANNRYGEICMLALNQAKTNKLYVHSGKKDPDFYYGSAIELTLKELRTNLEEYSNKKVAFNGIITRNYNNGVYIESYDEETDLYFGMYCYYAYNMDGFSLDVLSVGNEVRIVGSLQYYEAGDSWQVSGLQPVDLFDPTNAETLQLISENNEPAYKLTDPKTFATGKITLEVIDPDGEDGEEMIEKQFDYGELALNTSVAMNNLKVTNIYTTSSETSSNGAMTLTCQAPDGTTIKVRTVQLKDQDGNLITQDAYYGKTINVKGIVDYFNGYQIQVLSSNFIEIVG